MYMQLSGLQAQFAKASEMAHSLENACAEQSECAKLIFSCSIDHNYVCTYVMTL